MDALIPWLGVASVLAASAAWVLRLDRRAMARVSAMAPPRGRSRPSLGRLLEAVGRGRVGRWIGAGEDGRLALRVEAAGIRWPVEAVAGLKAVLAAGPALLILLLTGGGLFGLVAAALVGTAAFRLPDFALARRGRARRAEMEFRVPDLVELLVATTEAGLAPPVALARSSEVLRGPLGDELRRAVAEIGLGVPWRAAMDGMVERTQVASLRRLAGALSRSSRLGASVRATLRGVADELRAERRTRAEEMARQAPVKMLFPLVFLILPAFLLLTVGPVVLATVHSLRSG